MSSGGALDSSVTLEEVFTVLGARRVPLAPELAGYLVLEVAEHADPTGGDVDPKSVFVSEEGSVALVKPRREAAAGDAETSVRALLARLLEASGSQTRRRCRRRASAGAAPASPASPRLETALIPVNRAAGRGALARLAREVRRDRRLGVGRNRVAVVGRRSPAPSRRSPRNPSTHAYAAPASERSRPARRHSVHPRRWSPSPRGLPRRPSRTKKTPRPRARARIPDELLRIATAGRLERSCPRCSSSQRASRLLSESTRRRRRPDRRLRRLRRRRAAARARPQGDGRSRSRLPPSPVGAHSPGPHAASAPAGPGSPPPIPAGGTRERPSESLLALASPGASGREPPARARPGANPAAYAQAATRARPPAPRQARSQVRRSRDTPPARTRKIRVGPAWLAVLAVPALVVAGGVFAGAPRSCARTRRPATGPIAPEPPPSAAAVRRRPGLQGDPRPDRRRPAEGRGPHARRASAGRPRREDAGGSATRVRRHGRGLRAEAGGRTGGSDLWIAARTGSRGSRPPKVQLDRSTAKGGGNGPLAPRRRWEARSAGSGPPGTVHVVATPHGAEVWMLAGMGHPEARISSGSGCDRDLDDSSWQVRRRSRKRMRVTRRATSASKPDRNPTAGRGPRRRRSRGRRGSAPGRRAGRGSPAGRRCNVVGKAGAPCTSKTSRSSSALEIPVAWQLVFFRNKRSR